LQRSIISILFTRFGSTVINFAIALLIARHAGPAIKGEVTLLVTTSWFFIFFSNILGGQALVYLVPRNKTELLVIPAYVWSFIIAILGFFFLQSTLLVHAKHIPAITVLSLLSSLITVHQTILLARKRIGDSNLLQLVPLLLQLAGILYCFYFKHINDAYAYIYASSLAYSVTLVISFFMIIPHVKFGGFIRNFSFGELRDSFRYGILFQLVEIFQLLNLRYYFFQLGVQQGSQYLGVYSIGISILEAVWNIPRSISTVHYVSTSNSTEIKQEVNRTLMLTKFGLVTSGVALLLLWAVPSSVYTFVFGPGFHDVRHSVRYLFPGIWVYSLPIVISSFYLGTGNYKPLIISNLVGAVSVFVFSILLIPPYVMSGAGLAATLSFAIAAFILFLYFMMDNHIALKQFLVSRNDIGFFIGYMRGWMKGMARRGEGRM